MKSFVHQIRLEVTPCNQLVVKVSITTVTKILSHINIVCVLNIDYNYNRIER